MGFSIINAPLQIVKNRADKLACQSDFGSAQEYNQVSGSFFSFSRISTIAPFESRM